MSFTWNLFQTFACVFQVQQTSKRLDTEVCNVRMPGRSKYKWEQKKHVWFVTWGKWAAEEKNKLDNSPSFLEEEAIRWGTVPPGFPCAELLPCAVLHDLYGSAEQDLMGSFKALPYGIPETLHSPYYRHTQTLNCYSCYVVIITIIVATHTHHSHCPMIHIVVATQKQKVWFI